MQWKERTKSNDFVNMEPGVYEIQGKDIYAQVFDAETGSVEEKRPESHKNYLDVQFLVHTATFRGQQGRISRTVWAILNGQPSRSAERTFVHSANQYSL